LTASPSPRKTRAPQAINSSITRTVAGAPRGKLAKETLWVPILPLYNGNRGAHHQDGESMAPVVSARDLTVPRSQEPTTMGATPSCSIEASRWDAWYSTAICGVNRSLIG